MKKIDVLVIGGGPAGIIAAVTAKKNYPNKKIVLIREHESVVVPCGIPYIFNRLDSVKKNVMPDASLHNNKIDLIIKKVENILQKDKIVVLSDNSKIAYDKLILATGSKPAMIPIDGINKAGVWQIKKDFKYLEKLRRAVLKAKNIVIIGGGYIGLELAEELSSIKGKKISIIEKLNCCLATTMDKEFSLLVENKLKENGVDIHTGVLVNKIEGKKSVEYVKLSNGKKVLADLVIVSIGAKPQTDIAKEAGIKLGNYDAIKVDKHMKTNITNVFAIGDCSETKDFFTNNHFPVMLASTACYEARIAAVNLYRNKNLIVNNGTLASFSTSIYHTAIGAVGLNERMAKERGFSTFTGTSECPSKHPGSLPGSTKVIVKLIFSKPKGLLIGAQLAGPDCISEMVNVIALAIQKKVTIHDLNTLQVATHPLLISAPTVYPLITAAQSALSKKN